MAGGVSFDGSDLGRLAADLDASVPLVRDKAAGAVEFTAVNVKNNARDAIKGARNATHYYRSITHDVRSVTGGIEAEIGPDKGGPQGALGNLLEYGSINNAPHKHMQPALDRNEADFVRGLEKAIQDSMRGFS